MTQASAACHRRSSEREHYCLDLSRARSLYAITLSDGVGPCPPRSLPPGTPAAASSAPSGTTPIRAWALALPAIAAATCCPDTAVRDFLDSCDGRHFSDEVVNSLFRGRALNPDAAIERWMGWRIGRRISRETGISHDLPYLTGFVANAEIEAEMAA